MLSVLVSIAGAVQPNALAVYDKVNPLFEIGGEKVLDSWGQPLFVEHGMPYWRWEDGVVCCAVRDGQPMLAAYSEIVDSFKEMSREMLNRYQKAKDELSSLIGPEDVASEGNIRPQLEIFGDVKNFMAYWQHGELEITLSCMYDDKLRTTSFHFMVRRKGFTF